MSLQNIAEILSLASSVPTIMLGLTVVYCWTAACFTALQKPNDKRDGPDWFVVGVWLGFVGSVLDNVCWFIPWSASYIRHPMFDELFNMGVYFNVFSRQLLGGLAAYCHLRAAVCATNSTLTKPTLNVIVVLSAVFGVLYVSFLGLLR